MTPPPDAARSSMPVVDWLDGAHAAALLSAMHEGVVIHDGTSAIIAANPAAERILGLTLSQLQGRTPLHPGWRCVRADGSEWAGGDLPVMQTLHDGVPRYGELMGVGSTGQIRWLRVNVIPVHGPAGADGVPSLVGIVTTFVDITGTDGAPQIPDPTLAGALLAQQATHDPLTGLPNRHLLATRLEEGLVRARSTGTTVALLFCDVDHFKRINDSLGHDAGDLLLVEVGRRLRAVVRPHDTAARLDGDEFTLLCPDLRSREEALEVAARVRLAVEAPFAISGLSISLSLSIGLAFADCDDAAEDLISRADTAMYHAKARGRERIEVFDETLRHDARHRLQVETDLRAAIPGGQLALWAQPVVDLATGAAVGHECLIRWHHPTHGLLTPGAFLDVAEGCDLIIGLGVWTLHEACRLGATVPTFPPPNRIAVNVSARQLLQPDFRATVEHALAEGGLNPERLVLELTETALVQADTNALADISALRQIGVKLAVDDFGTGYSSLNYLQRLPVAIVKIDGSFCADIVTDHRQRALTQAIIDLGRALDLDIVAEGVETAEQAAMLVEMGCPFAQGWHFGRPAPMVPAADDPGITLGQTATLAKRRR